LCVYKKYHRSAAQLYADTFAAEPNQAEARMPQHRYNAARAAALAGCGRGEDAQQLDDKERTRWRKQTLDRLRAGLALRSKQADSGKPSDRAKVAKNLRHWQHDPDLSGIREAKELAQLPADERQTCEKLWADVAALLKKIKAPK